MPSQAPQAHPAECAQLPHWHPEECPSKLANHPGAAVAASAVTAADELCTKARREEASAAMLRL